MIYVGECLAIFSSRSFIVSGLTFRSLIYFEFIFVYGVKKCSSFILFIAMVNGIVSLIFFFYFLILSVNSKWIKDLNIRPGAIKILEENIGKTLSDINHSRVLYDHLPEYWK